MVVIAWQGDTWLGQLRPPFLDDLVFQMPSICLIYQATLPLIDIDCIHWLKNSKDLFTFWSYVESIWIQSMDWSEGHIYKTKPSKTWKHPWKSMVSISFPLKPIRWYQGLRCVRSVYAGVQRVEVHVPPGAQVAALKDCAIGNFNAWARNRHCCVNQPCYYFLLYMLRYWLNIGSLYNVIHWTCDSQSMVQYWFMIVALTLIIINPTPLISSIQLSTGFEHLPEACLVGDFLVL